MCISDCSSDVCSSDLWLESHRELWDSFHDDLISAYRLVSTEGAARPVSYDYGIAGDGASDRLSVNAKGTTHIDQKSRSEEHTSELQSLMRISYAVFCLKKKKQHKKKRNKIKDQLTYTQRYHHK